MSTCALTLHPDEPELPSGFPADKEKNLNSQTQKTLSALPHPTPFLSQLQQDLAFEGIDPVKACNNMDLG